MKKAIPGHSSYSSRICIKIEITFKITWGEENGSFDFLWAIWERRTQAECFCFFLSTEDDSSLVAFQVATLRFAYI